MHALKKTLLILLISIGQLAPLSAQQKKEDPNAGLNNDWQQLDKGLELGTFLASRPSEMGDSLIRILRIDPQRYKFMLFNASAIKNGFALSAKQWCLQNGLVAAVNAAMYQTDYKTSVSLMRTKKHINNRRLSKDMTILAFERQSLEVPPVKIIDRECEDFKIWEKKYGTLIQSIRMISCSGKNVWRQQTKKWSTAAIGIDQHNRVLFIHVRSPYSTHDLIKILLTLPLKIARAMYVEGGPEAQLYIRNGDQEYEFVGAYEINWVEKNSASFSLPIPNVVGISLRK